MNINKLLQEMAVATGNEIRSALVKKMKDLVDQKNFKDAVKIFVNAGGNNLTGIFKQFGQYPEFVAILKEKRNKLGLSKRGPSKTKNKEEIKDINFNEHLKNVKIALKTVRDSFKTDIIKFNENIGGIGKITTDEEIQKKKDYINELKNRLKEIDEFLNFKVKKPEDNLELKKLMFTLMKKYFKNKEKNIKDIEKIKDEIKKMPPSKEKLDLIKKMRVDNEIKGGGGRSSTLTSKIAQHLKELKNIQDKLKKMKERYNTGKDFYPAQIKVLKQLAEQELKILQDIKTNRIQTYSQKSTEKAQTIQKSIKKAINLFQKFKNDDSLAVNVYDTLNDIANGTIIRLKVLLQSGSRAKTELMAHIKYPKKNVKESILWNIKN